MHINIMICFLALRILTVNRTKTSAQKLTSEICVSAVGKQKLGTEIMIDWIRLCQSVDLRNDRIACFQFLRKSVTQKSCFIEGFHWFSMFLPILLTGGQIITGPNPIAEESVPSAGQTLIFCD